MHRDFNDLRVYSRPPDTTETHRSSGKSAAASLGIKPTVCFRSAGKSADHTITHPHPPHPCDIEHLIKVTLSGSNVTVLCRSLSIPPWPLPAANFAGCEGLMVQQNGDMLGYKRWWEVTHLVLKTPGNDQPLPASAAQLLSLGMCSPWGWG